MEVLRVEAMKFTAGSWEKVGPVLKKIEEQGKGAGFPTVTMYASVSGGDIMHTLYLITEWSSLAQMEATEDKLAGEKAMMEAIEKLAEIVDSSEVMLLRKLSGKDLGM